MALFSCNLVALSAALTLLSTGLRVDADLDERDHVTVAEMTVARRVLEELQRSSRPLDDDELARRLGVSRRQTVNQVCRRLDQAGQLRRYVGPGGKIVNDLDRADVPLAGHKPTPMVTSAQDLQLRAAASGTQQGCGAALPGHVISAAVLSAADFRPLALQVRSLEVDLPSGRGCEWTIIGDIPDSPGLYLFTVEDDHQLRVAYVGLTGHLWMVTNGRLPGGAGARRGQRYARPRHAGATRHRVNVLIADSFEPDGRYGSGCARFP